MKGTLMTPERVRERRRERLIAMFKIYATQLREELGTHDPAFCANLIGTDMKTLESAHLELVEFFLDHVIEQESTCLAPPPIERPKSGGRSSSVWP